MRNENISRIVDRAIRELDVLAAANAEQLQLHHVRALYLGVALVGTIAISALTLYEAHI